MIKLFVNNITKFNKSVLPTRSLSTFLVYNNKNYYINKINCKFSNNNNKLKNEINNLNQIQQNKYYSTTTTTATIKDQEINEIIRNVENNPNDADLLMKLCDKFIEFKDAKSKTIVLNGKETKLLDLLLQIIDIDAAYPSVFYKTFTWVDCLDQSETTIKGRSVKKRDLLIYELANNPNHIDSLTALVKITPDWDEQIVIPEFTLKIDPITGIEKEEVQILGYTKMHLLIKILDLDATNAFAKMGIIVYMKSLTRDKIKLKNGQVKSLKQLSIELYLENKDKRDAPDFIWLSLLDQLPKDELIVTIGDKEVNVIRFILDAINRFPLCSGLYYHISLRIKDNHVVYIINSQISNNTDKLFGRLNFISYAIIIEEMDKSNSTYEKQFKLSQYYFIFGSYLFTRDQVVVRSNNQKMGKVDFFIKALEHDPCFPECKIELIKCMKDDESFKINGKDYSKVELTLSILDGITEKSQIIFRNRFIYSKLIEIYENQGDQNMVQHYTNLLNQNNQVAIDILINMINGDPTHHLNWLNLSKHLNDKETMVLVSNDFGKMNKMDLLLKTIQLKPTTKDAHYELSLLLSNDQDTITLLNGSILNKRDLLEIEVANNVNNLEATINLLKIIPDSEFEGGFSKLDVLKGMVQIDFGFKQAYLEIGIILSDNSIPNITFITKNGVPILSDKKSLFIQFLKLDNPEDPTVGSDNILALYYLSLEMDNNEIQFGKTKKQILRQILLQDPSFSRVYSELSIFLKDNTEIDLETGLNRIELMVKSIFHESDISILSNHYYKLSTYLNDTSSPTTTSVTLHDGRIMNFQKLLIEAIEINPRSIYSNSPSKLSLIYKQLGISLNEDNGSITLFGKEASKTELLETALQLSNINRNYFESLKIKSSLYLDQFNKFIK